MNKYLCVIVSISAFIILSGCSSTAPSYRSEVKVRPISSGNSKKEMYFIEVDVFKIDKDGNSKIVSSPQLALAEDEEGEISVKNEGTGFTTKALVTRESGKLELVTTMTETRNEEVVWTENNKTAVME